MMYSTELLICFSTKYQLYCSLTIQIMKLYAKIIKNLKYF